jgi:hypothetical protein
MGTKQEAAGWTYYTWDVDESLTRIQAPDVTLANKYNSRMQRVARDEDGDSETLVYDGQKLLAEAATSALSRYYLSEGGSVSSPLVSQLGSQHWFLFDALGSTLGLTNEAGSLSDSFLYEAFGMSLGRTGVLTTPYRYGGGRGWVHEVGLNLTLLAETWAELAKLTVLSPSVLLSRAPTYSPAAVLSMLGLGTSIDGLNTRLQWVSTRLVDWLTFGSALWAYECGTIGNELHFPAVVLSDLLLPDFPRNESPRDAMRHCLWMCMTSAIMGPECALVVGTGHEVWVGAENVFLRKQPLNWPSIDMDRHNNRVGAELGSHLRCSKDPANDCERACSGALADGRLQRWNEFQYGTF